MEPSTERVPRRKSRAMIIVGEDWFYADEVEGRRRRS